MTSDPSSFPFPTTPLLSTLSSTTSLLPLLLLPVHPISTLPVAVAPRLVDAPPLSAEVAEVVVGVVGGARHRTLQLDEDEAILIELDARFLGFVQ
jgi:hypothetical protein